MISMVFSLFILPLISGHLYNLECGSDDVSDFTLEPSDDGVSGRYLVQWCSLLTNPTTIEKWTFFLYTRNVSITECEFYKISDKQYIHSRIEKEIYKTFECPVKTCVSTYLDLVYTGCYTIRNEFHLAQNKRSNDYRLRYIVSALNSLDDINNMKSAFVTESIGENIMLKIDSRIPLTDYSVKLCHDEDCRYIENNCSVSKVPDVQLWSARCFTSAPLPQGNYTGDDQSSSGRLRLAALVSHLSPWTHGVLFQPDIKDVYCYFSYSAVAVSVPSRSVSSVRWSLCALGVCTLAGVIMCVLRLRRTGKLPHNRYNSMTESLPAKLRSSSASDVILLVYCRDVPVCWKALDALTNCIQDNGIGRVVSLYSASTAAACGGSGAAWLRSLLAAGARVLLLQTETLHAATTEPHAVVPHGQHGSPFGSQFGDTLVAIVLRCLRAAHTDTHAYRTYYVANLSPRPCELVPLVCPYRRYELPEALPTLLDHLAPGAVTNTQSMLDAMQHMCTYLEFVTNNHDYLNELDSHS